MAKFKRARVRPEVPEGYSWHLQKPPAGPDHMGRHLLLYKGKFTGYAIEHCGHQTALRPYSIYRPNNCDHGHKDLGKLKLQLIKEHQNELLSRDLGH